MPQVGVAIAGLVATVKTSAVFTFLTTTFVGKLLTSVALSALLRALQPKPKPNQGGIVSETTSTGEEIGQGAVLGYYATAGHHLCPPMTHGNVGRVQNAYLTYVVAVSDVPGASLQSLIVNDEVVNFGGVAETEGFPALGTFAGHLWVRFYDGSQTTADSYLLSRYGSASDHAARTGRPWLSDMVGRGMCYAVVTFRYNRQLYNALPSVRFVLNGIPLYDPRQDTTVGGSGSQRWADRSTWTFTTNPKVMIYNIMRGIEIPESGVWGPQVAAEDLPLSSWFAAMNACDESVGGVPQYRAGYEFSVLQEPAEVIEELEKVCSGAMSEFGGVWKARAGAPGMPVYYFSDDDLIMDEGTTFVPFGSLNETYNGITARYPDPAQLWQAKEAPPRFNSILEAEDFGRRLVASLNLSACPYAEQVQRLMQAYISDERRFRRHSLVLPPDAAVLEPLDVVGWTSSENGYISKAFEVTEIGDDLGTMIQRLALREIDNADYDWAPADEITFDTPSVVIGRPVPVIVDLFTVTGITLDDSLSAPRRPALLLEWSEDEFDSMWGVRYEVRRAGTTEVVAAGVMNSPEARRFVVQGVLPNTTYEARIAFLFNGALEGAWTAWELATTPDVRLTPDDIAQSIIQEIDQAQATADNAGADAAAALAAANAVEATSTSSLVLRPIGGTGAANIRIVEWGDETGAGSAIVLSGDNVIAPGTLSASRLVVTDLSGNLWVNGDFAWGDFRAWDTPPNGWTVAARDPLSGTPAIADMPTAYAVQTDVDPLADQFFAQAEPFACRAGDRFTVSFDYAGAGASISLNMGAQIVWFDEVGTAVDVSSVAVTGYASTAWASRAPAAVEAPVGAVFAMARLYILGGSTGAGLISNLKLDRQRAGSVLITPNSITGAQLITSQAVITASAQLADAVISRAKIGLLEVDSARIAELTVGTSKIANGAVTGAGAAYGGVTLLSTAGWTTIAAVAVGTEGGRTMTISAVASCFSGGSGAGAAGFGRVRIVANSTVLQETDNYLTEEIPLLAVFTSTGGSTTIFLQGIKAGGDGNFSASGRILGLELKK